MNEQQPDKVQLPTNFDPYDPNVGSTYRRDVVRDVTDFRTRGGSSETDQDRISRLEDRVSKLESLLQQMLQPTLRPLTPADKYGGR